MIKRMFKYRLVGIAPLIAAGILHVNCSTKPQKSSDAESNSATESSIRIEDTSSPTPENVTEYWTPERMRDAKPIPFPDAVIPQDGQSTDSDDNATNE
jgi:hypothetical protein